MAGTHPNGFAHALNTANVWLSAVTEALGTEDRHFAQRALRGWLHALRDRLTIDVAAHLGAQLPELLRGIYYEGWDPSNVPVKYNREGFVDRFVHEAKVSAGDVPRMAPAITAAVHRQVSPGQLEAVFEQLPHDVRALLEPAG